MQRSRAPILFGILVLITVVPVLIKFYTDWIWFAQVGYLEVFLRSITARLALGSIAFVLAFGVLAANFYLAQGAQRRREFRIMGEAGPRIVSVDLTRIKAFVYLSAGVLAFLIALYASSQWETWLLWRHAVPFGSTDPILGNDTAFYIFQLPFYQFVQGLVLVTVLLAAAGVAGAHGASGNLSFDAARGVVATRIVTRHLSVLGALVLLLLAVGTYLRIPELLTTDSGTVFGASYADVHARMPALRLLIAACLIGAALALFQVRLQRLWPAQVHAVRGRRGRRLGWALPAADVRDPVPVHGHALLAKPHAGDARDAVSPDLGARASDRPLPDLRSGPLPGDLRRRSGLDPGRLHHQRQLPLLDPRRERSQLHPQLREGHHQRLRREDDVPPAGPRRPDRGDTRSRLPGPLHTARGDGGRPAHAPALPARHLRDSGGDVLDVPHDESRGLSTTVRTSGTSRRSMTASSRGGWSPTTPS